jgi:asparagine synthetase B (glutamine-hydrolysing)
LTLNEQLVASPSQLTKQSPSVVRLEQLLRDSLALRVLNIPDPPTLLGAIPAKGSSTPARLAILFSGGLDCTVLARISHELLPLSEPIDLLNVAFQNPRIHKASDIDAEAFEAALESCPDRITGRVSYAELCQVCPGRQWRFVAINVPYTETVEHQDKIITLMHPHNTEMDLSIACALYFAARGTGMMCSDGSDQSVPYTTTARVLLSGLGADELFAGYTRHATAYNRHGSRDLLDELKLDIGRLGKRNLGRDDRVITNWGKEARFPFLDEKLVAWALAAPVSDKCDFGAAANTENDLSAHLESCKKVLRCLAWRLGMCKVASEKKRAVCQTLAREKNQQLTSCRSSSAPARRR